MAKTYAIQVLDAAGEVILSKRGRAGALQDAIDALYDYRAACKAASGLLFTGDRTRRDTIVIDGVRGLTAGHMADADTVIGHLDRWGAAGTKARYDRIAAAIEGEAA